MVQREENGLVLSTTENQLKTGLGDYKCLCRRGCKKRSSFSVKVKTLLDDETAFLPEISPSVLIACSEFAEGDGIEAPHGSPAKAAMGHLITVFQEA